MWHLKPRFEACIINVEITLWGYLYIKNDVSVHQGFKTTINLYLSITKFKEPFDDLFLVNTTRDSYIFFSTLYSSLKQVMVFSVRFQYIIFTKTQHSTKFQAFKYRITKTEQNQQAINSNQPKFYIDKTNTTEITQQNYVKSYYMCVNECLQLKYI